MDVEKLINPITNYLTFFIDFWFYCDGCLKEFAHLQKVSTSALFLTLVGIAIYLIIRYTDLKIVEPDPNPDHGGSPSFSTSTIVLFFFMSLVSAVILEVSFLILDARSKANFGQIYSSLNASFLFGAATMPLSAVQLRLSYITIKIQKTRGWAKWPLLAINTSFGIFYLILIIKSYFRIFSAAHNVRWDDLVGPSILSLIIFLLISLPFLKALWQWIVYVRENRQT